MIQQQDDALLAAFHLMDADERDFFLDIALTHTEGRSNTKPRLKLIVNKPTNH